MAKINPSLIFSIASDLNDLHKIGHEMINFDGKCEMVSWKYPNKCMKDIEIDNNEVYDTWEKYVLLLELIIDRLYLIMALSTTILDSLPNLSNIFKLPKNVQRTSATSLGSVTVFFWRRLQALMIPENLMSRSVTNTYNLNEQSDKSFTNCESCHLAMKMVKELTGTIEECMKENALRSKISEQRSVVLKQIFNMSQYESMQQWIDAIVYDLKHLSEFSHKRSSELKIVKDQLANVKAYNESNLTKLQISQIKYTDLEKLYKNDENQIRNLTEMNTALELNCRKTTAALTLSQESRKISEVKVQELENKLNQTVTDYEITLNNVKSEYLRQVAEVNNEKSHWLEMYGKGKQDVSELENKLKLEREKQIESETKLLKDFVKEKQKIEEEKRKVEKENRTLVGKEEVLEKQIKDYIGKNVNTREEILKLNEEIKTCKEREVFLVRYPDLNGSLYKNTSKNTRDPFQDMEQQLMANDIRIDLLQKQNVTLRRTINKMKTFRPSTKAEYNGK